MPVTPNTGTVVPVTGIETPVATIAGGPFDKVSVYFQGGQFGGGGPLGLALYATVNGFQTRVAQTQVMGSPTASVVRWQVPNDLGPLAGDSATDDEQYNVDAGGTNYTVTVIDLSNGLPPPGTAPRQAVTMTIAGVNTFDTAPNLNRGAVFALSPAVPVGVLPFLAGYAQQMDVAVGQSQLPQVTIKVTANNGPGSLTAIIAEATLGGTSPTVIGPVFRGLQLPVAIIYLVTITNDSGQTFSVPLTACTYSTAITAGGAVVLLGDVIGPSNNNTVIKWDNVPLDLATMGVPVIGDVPQFTAAGWSAVPISTAVGPLSPDVTGFIGANEVVQWMHVPLNPATMSAPAVGDVPVFNVDGSWHAAPIGAAIILTGNANGPASANTVEAFGIESVGANVLAAQFVPAAGYWYVGISGLTPANPNLTVTIPDMPSGSEIIVKCEDGSLSPGFTITVMSASGKTIDGNPTDVLTSANPGPKGARRYMMNFNTPTEWSIV